MQEISEFERRIVSALERADRALGSLGAGGGDGGPDLSAELEAERVANAQLEERVRAIKETQETTVARLEAEVARLSDALAARDATVEQMRAVNEELRRSNAALRDAQRDGLAEPSLINSSMMSELESLRAQREADRAELDDILATLEPVLKEA